MASLCRPAPFGWVVRYYLMPALQTRLDSDPSLPAVPVVNLQGTLLVAALNGATSRQELLYLFSQYGELREVR